MKLKNNLTREAFEESYFEQGYDREQVKALMWMLDNDLDFLHLMSVNIDSDYMNMLIELAEADFDVKEEYFFEDGTLDIDSVEWDYDRL